MLSFIRGKSPVVSSGKFLSPKHREGFQVCQGPGGEKIEFGDSGPGDFICYDTQALNKLS